MDTPIPRDCSNISNVLSAEDQQVLFDNQHNLKKIKTQKLFFLELAKEISARKKLRRSE